ncbi:hypothetical protein AMTR_s00028p00164730 [Amborella trichopoda]|uniref:Uncharacterized protein n=1 Tax=Amborella trichopoda TaxID=13333 RepID=W1PKS7_AMBTC|nr:hypothetical protein AMTR_s00028p00164730 [Amborella trichopoda]
MEGWRKAGRFAGRLESPKRSGTGRWRKWVEEVGRDVWKKGGGGAVVRSWLVWEGWLKAVVEAELRSTRVGDGGVVVIENEPQLMMWERWKRLVIGGGSCR